MRWEGISQKASLMLSASDSFESERCRLLWPPGMGKAGESPSVGTRDRCLETRSVLMRRGSVQLHTRLQRTGDSKLLSHDSEARIVTSAAFWSWWQPVTEGDLHTEEGGAGSSAWSMTASPSRTGRSSSRSPCCSSTLRTDWFSGWQVRYDGDDDGHFQKQNRGLNVSELLITK